MSELALADGGGLNLPESILLYRLIAAFAYGCVAVVIHLLTSASTKGADRSLHATLVMLSVLIAVVTIVVGQNIARAFSLAGVLAIVRFRTVVDDTRDTAFVIYAVVAGMAVGGGLYWEPAMATPLMLAAAYLFKPLPTTKAPSHGELIVRLTAGKAIDHTIEDLLKKHLKGHHLVGMSTARGGSALDATFAIPFPAADKMFNLISELGRVEGVQSVEVKEM